MVILYSVWSRAYTQAFFYTACAHSLGSDTLLFFLACHSDFDSDFDALDDVRGQEPEELDCSPISRT